jgi:GGDEF domain-containing protein
VTANAGDSARIRRHRPDQLAVVVEDSMRDDAQLLVDRIREAIRSSPTESEPSA